MSHWTDHWMGWTHSHVDIITWSLYSQLRRGKTDKNVAEAAISVCLNSN